MPPPSRRPSSSFRFVHTADLHLGSRFITPPGMDQKTAADLAGATYSAWREIVDLCIREAVDFLLVAGDVYDSEDQNIRAQLQFIEGLKRLGENGIAAYIVRGNHDPDDAWSRSIKMPENAFVFSSQEPEVIIHRGRKDKPLAAIVGMSFATAHIMDNLAGRFPRREKGWPCTIGLLHCNVGGVPGHEPYAPCSAQDLRRCGYDYWALGHIHQPTVIEDRDPWIVYAGNPQGRDLGETGDRGCHLVTVGANGAVEVKTVRTTRYLWKVIEIDVTGSVDLGVLEEEIRKELVIVSEKAGIPVVGRIILTGATRLHGELVAAGGLAALEERLIEDPPASNYPIYPERIICRTVPVIDRDAVHSRDDILGEICRQSDLAISSKSGQIRLKEKISPLHQYARAYVSEPDDEELNAIIREAEALLLSRLSEGERE
ncbi:DNA repair exonuclease [Methanoculleus sp.]|uniref:metallophosphoesterase family protein n=1 Tax=Methanoculleus sp. TaxID=90427 RepID=UPI00261B8D9C|nr:DNA repair exonuclease [Methanoculleus sp.]MDI6867877.1 DNA repair exonuclease [Methanoculleus sp.]